MKFSIIKDGAKKDISSIYFMHIPIVQLMYGTKELWKKITSCFGSGTWISSSNWSSVDLWKN